ncbi:hypothetical protein LEP1GSC131_0489 [Leptospira kirschneri str. 200802841]|uniref:Uncharacterized protein n=1 Tax=Leptospira kirschneri str. 200802841 TaxID=1193047 RepID=A0A828Y8X9_9LEPT|nr:hypothetical protein LEP1GSC131_0489 [Leptospira kirschneri str. 200802841]
MSFFNRSKRFSKDLYELNILETKASHSQWVVRRVTKEKIIIRKMFKFIFPIKAGRK